jgi:hypothetical protein
MNSSQADDAAEYPWYWVVSASDPLEQGDFLDNFPILLLEVEAFVSLGQQASEPVDAKSRDFNVVVLSQSCDLRGCQDEDQVILCPRWDYTEMAKLHSSHRGKDGWNKLRNGRLVHSHLLSRCTIEGHEFDYQVVSLRQVFTVTYGLVRHVADEQGPRVRLNPPYREHLAQAFARQFMRIGLPSVLPAEYPY